MTEPTLSAGIVPVRFVEGEPRFLLLRAYRYWDFPKGEVEPGEDPLEAALREAAEEAGLDDLELRWGTIHRETAPYRRGRKVARYYLAASPKAEARLRVNEALGGPEHHELRWVTYEEARALLGSRVGEILEWAREILV